MFSGKNGVYLFVSAACLAGYTWLFVNLYHASASQKLPGVCLVKNITGIPCPACGSTRSVMSLLHGDFYTALYYNPLGFLVVALMIVCPIWILNDVITKRNSFYTFYRLAEAKLKKPYIAIPAILLVIANWTWNIIKGL
jgi:hypothetical protein